MSPVCSVAVSQRICTLPLSVRVPRSTPISLSLSLACLDILVSMCCAVVQPAEFRTVQVRASPLPFDMFKTAAAFEKPRLRSQHRDGASNDLQPGGQGLYVLQVLDGGSSSVTGCDLRLSASRGRIGIKV